MLWDELLARHRLKQMECATGLLGATGSIALDRPVRGRRGEVIQNLDLSVRELNKGGHFAVQLTIWLGEPNDGHSFGRRMTYWPKARPLAVKETDAALTELERVVASRNDATANWHPAKCHA